MTSGNSIIIIIIIIIQTQTNKVQQELCNQHKLLLKQGKQNRTTNECKIDVITGHSTNHMNQKVLLFLQCLSM